MQSSNVLVRFTVLLAFVFVVPLFVVVGTALHLVLLRNIVAKGSQLVTISPSSSRSVAIASKLTASSRVLLALLAVLLLLRELLISRWLLLLLRISVRASELITLLIVG